MTPIDKLKAVLCDPEGKCCIHGSDEDRRIVDEAITALQSIIAQHALDKMAENARDLGLDCEPAVQEPVFCEYCGGNDDADFGLPTDHCTDCARPQPAAQQTCNCRWEGEVQIQQCTLHEAHVAAIHEWAERAKAAEARLKAQPVPVKTYHDGKPWPVAPKPWVGLSKKDKEFIELTGGKSDVLLAELVESKLKEKNHG
jgi:hypothetical protein